MLKIKHRIHVYNQRFIIFLYKIKNLFIELFHDDYFVLTSSVWPLTVNWGDDASLVIAKLLSPKSRFIINRYSWNIKNKKNYLCIGSIITWMTDSTSVIWGAGIVYPQQEIKQRPLKVLAVRGPLTRQYLLDRNIPCPEIYGDPAVLFPRFYKPNKQKKYLLGIIPHFRDQQNPVIAKLLSSSNVCLIDVRNCTPWHRFIDDIASCEYIVSSSLHGIIISDAYGIPNRWIQIESALFGTGEKKEFAFRDYYASIGIETIEPFIVNEMTSVNDMISDCSINSQENIDLELLYNSCPFIHNQ